MNPHSANDNRYGYCGYHNICGSQMVGVSSHKWNNLSTLMSPGQALYCVHKPRGLAIICHIKKCFMSVGARKIKSTSVENSALRYYTVPHTVFGSFLSFLKHF